MLQEQQRLHCLVLLKFSSGQISSDSHFICLCLTRNALQLSFQFFFFSFSSLFWTDREQLLHLRVTQTALLLSLYFFFSTVFLDGQTVVIVFACHAKTFASPLDFFFSTVFSDGQTKSFSVFRLLLFQAHETSILGKTGQILHNKC